MYNRLIIKAFGEIAEEEGGAIRILILNDEMAQIDRRYLVPRAMVRAFARSKIGLVFFFIAALLRSRPDLIVFGHVNLAPLGFLARLLRRHASQWLLVYGIDFWQRLPLVRRAAARRADRIISISEYTRRVGAIANGVPLDRIDLVPCALDPFWQARFEPLQARTTNTEPVSLLTVARLSAAERYKGIDTTIRCLRLVEKRVGSVRYVIVGDGDDRPRLESLAKEEGVASAVQFRGRVSAEELAAAYTECSFFVMPSKSEGFGIVYLEAALFSKPSIAASEGGATEVVIDGVTGVLVPFDDIVALAGRIVELIENRRLREELGRNARTRLSELYTYTAVSSRIRKLLE